MNPDLACGMNRPGGGGCLVFKQANEGSWYRVLPKQTGDEPKQRHDCTQFSSTSTNLSISCAPVKMSNRGSRNLHESRKGGIPIRLSAPPNHTYSFPTASSLLSSVKKLNTMLTLIVPGARWVSASSATDTITRKRFSSEDMSHSRAIVPRGS